MKKKKRNVKKKLKENEKGRKDKIGITKRWKEIEVRGQ
jgi:hypothetical protein